MKRIILLTLIKVLFSTACYSQLTTFDAGANYQLGAIYQLELKRTITDEKKGIVDKLHQAKLIQETINIINTIKDVKNVIGTVSATVGDLKSVTKQFFQDFRGLESVSKDEINRLQELMSFRDALEGRGYQSVFGAYDWYQDETARFRDRSGHMNVASAILNESDPERAMQVYRSFKNSYFNMRKERLKCDDMSILEDLAWARYYERQARLLTVVYNVAAFENSANSLLNKVGGNVPNISLTKNGEKYRLTPEGMLILRQDIEANLEKGAIKRNEAFKKYEQFIRSQNTAIDLALLLQTIRRLKKDDQKLKDSYYNVPKSGTPGNYSETRKTWSQYTIN